MGCLYYSILLCFLNPLPADFHIVYSSSTWQEVFLLNIRHIAIGGFLVGLSITFQLIPVIFGELFVLVTIFSTLPIFIITRLNPKTGGVAFVVTAILVLSFNSHEGLFFIFTNGPVGLALGTLNYYSDMKSSPPPHGTFPLRIRGGLRGSSKKH